MTAGTLVTQFQRQVKFNTMLAQAVVTTWMERGLKGSQHNNLSWYFESVAKMMRHAVPNHAAIQAQQIRVQLEQVSALPLLTSVKIKPVKLGTVPGERQTPPSALPERIILYFHGGGYVSGSPRSHRLLTTQIALTAHVELFSMDYRLAPEYPYPAALEDAWIAYLWLVEHGVDPGKIVLAGDSAGGGLIIALMLALRDAHAPLPAGAVCLSPWFDLAFEATAFATDAGTDYLNEHIMRAAAQMYLNGADSHTPLASPIYANLYGLPPLLLQASQAEFIIDNAVKFAERAQAAGVNVRLETWENMIHVWHFLFMVAAEAREAIESVGRFVERVIG